MRALRSGLNGPDVKKWQYFLAGLGFTQVIANGVFDQATNDATRLFQQNNGLSPDGVAGTFTLAKAGSMGFELVKNPADNNADGIHWPMKPDFKSFSQRDYISRFGAFNWQLKPGPNPGREIIINGNWEKENIVLIDAPVFAPLPPYRASRMRVHKKVAHQFEQLFAHWQREGLTNLLESFDGAFNPRMIRGSDSNLSSHSYGIAFDINAASNGLGIIPPKIGTRGSVRKLAEIAHQYGFYWGGHFSRFDGMHFEVGRII